MKTITIVALFSLSVFSCSKQGENKIDSALTGLWGLTEILADPGDGSGTFQGVSSSKTLDFHADGTLTSNGDICTLSIESLSSSGGTYSLADSTITSSNCAGSAFRFTKTGTTLIVSYPCIEPCRVKYVKK